MSTLTETTFLAKEAFGEDYLPEDMRVTGYVEATEYVPAVKDTYVFTREGLRALLAWWQFGAQADGIYCFGPPGCGKSEGLEQFCARLNIPMYEVTMHRDLLVEDLLGQYSLAGSETTYRYGQLPKAMGVEGQPGLFVLNEVDRASEGVLPGLNEVFQGRPIAINANRSTVVRPSRGFRFAATGNTTMLHDPTGGLHRGAQRQDLSFVERFWTVPWTYPDPETEREILYRHVPALRGVPLGDRIVDGLLKVAADVRANFMGTSNEPDAVEITLSPRVLARWAKLWVLFQGASAHGQNPAEYALDLAGLSAASETSKVFVRKCLHNHLGDEASTGAP